VVQIKTPRRFVLGIDDQGEDRRLSPQRSCDRIDQQRPAEPAPAKSLIDRQSADEAGRQRGVTR
jgi:hypothetical protein